MVVVSEKQAKFQNFAEVKNFLNQINDDVDLSRSAPHNAVFSKSQGIVAGSSFSHLVNKLNEKFGFDLDAKGCIQGQAGYVLTFKDRLPTDKIEKNKKVEELNSKNKESLIELGKEKGLELKLAMKKEDMISAIMAV